MDREIVPRFSKLCDWVLSSPQDSLSFTPRQKGESDHLTRGPRKAWFHAYVIHYAVHWVSLQASGDHDREMSFPYLIIFTPNVFHRYEGRRTYQGKKLKHGENLQKLSFLDMY